uniref:Uncharacterized protein n=1 Tax=Arundo donax TaxID=35708 RepID=A0A0A8Y9D5_ARUDO
MFHKQASLTALMQMDKSGIKSNICVQHRGFGGI